jgi:hypothetical protein
MIDWTIPGTVVSTTGSSSTNFSAAESSSITYTEAFTVFAEVFSATSSASSSGSTSSSGQTVNDGAGATTQTFSAFAFSSTFESGNTADLTPEGQSDTNNIYEGPTTSSQSGSASSSSLTSGETTTVFTELKATSATSTYESNYEVTTSAEGFYYPWTTSSQGGTGPNSSKPVFFQVEAQTTTTMEAGQSTRQGTETYTEQLDETVTLSGLADTVVQAAPDEIIYVIRTMPTTWGGYLAASSLAESGTRFTLSPSLKTIARAAMSESTPTSTTQEPSYSTAVTFSVPSLIQTTITTASYFSFPPQTATRAINSFSLQSSLSVLSFDSYEETFGDGSTTVAQTSYFIIPTTVRRQTQAQTYEGLTTTTASLEVPSTVEAAVTLESSFATEGSSSGTTSYAEGNTIISAVRATLGAASPFGRTKYRTTGAVVGTETGGWITANATSSGFVPPGFYVLDGSGRNANRIFPQTNSTRTVDRNSISWTTSTAASSGTGTQKTTTSAEFGLSGETSIITDSRPLSIFGGTPGRGCAAVERPGAGVYKDRIDGSTATFSEGDIAFTEGETRPVKNWFPVSHIGPLELVQNLNPVAWTEARNSNDLPPNTPQDQF